MTSETGSILFVSPTRMGPGTRSALTRSVFVLDGKQRLPYTIHNTKIDHRKTIRRYWTLNHPRFSKIPQRNIVSFEFEAYNTNYSFSNRDHSIYGIKTIEKIWILAAPLKLPIFLVNQMKKCSIEHQIVQRASFTKAIHVKNFQ